MIASTPTNKPNMFIVGAFKCGTTAWYEYLRSHPNIFMSDVKEPCFFSSDFPNWCAVYSQDAYEGLFADAGAAKIIGEASAIYLASATAAQAIHAYNPTAKILILLRQQEDYLPSLHNQFLSEFAEDIGDFEQAWRLSGARTPETIPHTCVEPIALDYAAMGRFSEQVGRYVDLFPANQVRVMWFHDWIAKPHSAYLATLEFLGLEDDGRTEFPLVNRGVTLRSKRIVRWLHYPPANLRKITRFAKRLTGLQAETQQRLVARIENLLSAEGYKEQLNDQLRDEIRSYYAKDNRALHALIARTSTGSGAH